jgi:hypothetical protein
LPNSIVTFLGRKISRCHLRKKWKKEKEKGREHAGNRKKEEEEIKVKVIDIQ